MSELKITPVTEADLPALHEMNQAAVPHVGDITPQELRELFDQACYFGVARVDGELAGFLLALAPGQKYQSLNYRWFSERYDCFVYVDRIVVGPAFQRLGIGRALYEDVERAAAQGVGQVAGRKAEWITCEVNLRPPNPTSLAFHHRLGFQEVGQQDTEGGKKRVSLLAKRLARR